MCSSDALLAEKGSFGKDEESRTEVDAGLKWISNVADHQNDDIPRVACWNPGAVGNWNPGAEVAEVVCRANQVYSIHPLDCIKQVQLSILHQQLQRNGVEPLSEWIIGTLPSDRHLWNSWKWVVLVCRFVQMM